MHAALLGAVRSSTSHNRSDRVAPAAVLWTDRERHWESVVRADLRAVEALCYVQKYVQYLHRYRVDS